MELLVLNHISACLATVLLGRTGSASSRSGVPVKTLPTAALLYNAEPATTRFALCYMDTSKPYYNIFEMLKVEVTLNTSLPFMYI
jgi:hypothetical protein